MRSILRIMLLLALALPLSAQDAPPDIFQPQFNAVMTVVDKDKQYELHLYVDGSKYRIEHPQGIFVIRKDEQKTFMLMEQNKMAFVMPYSEKEIDKYKSLTNTSHSQLIGPDTVEGTACTKYQLTSESGEVSFLWATAAPRVPVKWMTADGKKEVLFKNYQIGPQDAQLFEIPADYQSMNLSGATMPSGT